MENNPINMADPSGHTAKPQQKSTAAQMAEEAAATAKPLSNTAELEAAKAKKMWDEIHARQKPTCTAAQQAQEQANRMWNSIKTGAPLYPEPEVSYQNGYYYINDIKTVATSLKEFALCLEANRLMKADTVKTLINQQHYDKMVEWYADYNRNSVTGGNNSNQVEQNTDIADDSKLMPGLGSVKLKNVANGKVYELSKGWSYRYENSPEPHIHLLRNNEDYSQKEDGRNHHGPKGGSGPPNSIKKELKEKTNWDWDALEEENAKKATVTRSGDGYIWTITYPDGSVYVRRDSIYFYLPEPSIETIIYYYYLASNPDSTNNSDTPEVFLPVVPTPVPVPTPMPTPAPMPFFAW